MKRDPIFNWTERQWMACIFASLPGAPGMMMLLGGHWRVAMFLLAAGVVLWLAYER